MFMRTPAGHTKTWLPPVRLDTFSGVHSSSSACLTNLSGKEVREPERSIRLKNVIVPPGVDLSKAVRYALVSSFLSDSKQRTRRGGGTNKPKKDSSSSEEESADRRVPQV